MILHIEFHIKDEGDNKNFLQCARIQKLYHYSFLKGEEGENCLSIIPGAGRKFPEREARISGNKRTTQGTYKKKSQDDL